MQRFAVVAPRLPAIAIGYCLFRHAVAAYSVRMNIEQLVELVVHTGESHHNIE